MTTPCIFLKSPLPARKKTAAVSALALAMLWLGNAALAAPASAGANDPGSNVPAAAALLAADYRQQHWQRLSAKSDRDSLIAATLIGLPTASQTPAMAGQTGLEQRLAGMSAHDPLAQFVLALACQAKKAACQDTRLHEALVRLAPDNAMHWLLLPAGTVPSPAQLHQAGLAKFSDAHTRELTRIVRAALGEQPVVTAPAGIDPHELSLQLRRNVLEALTAPNLVGVMASCRLPGQPHSDDCVAIARTLSADHSGSILPTMVGSAMIRRLLKGTPEADAALALRRDYVWLSIQAPLNSDDAAGEERLHAESAQYGEWEAWQRRLDRQGSPRQPPSGWTPPDPQVMLLAEDRKPATPSK